MLPNLSPSKVANSSVNYEFVSHVAARFFKIMFRSNKKIRMIYSEHSSKNLQENELYILNFKFKNALWYEIKNQRTDKSEFIISKDESPENVEIVVQGFFRKKIFKMNLSQSDISKARESRTRFSH